MRKHLKRKSLKYTTLNRYLKKRSSKRKLTSALKNSVPFSFLLPFSIFAKEKQTHNVVLNGKMLKILAVHEPTSYELLSLTFFV